MTKSLRYHTTQKRQEASNFKNYCADSYAVELLDHFIHSSEFEHLKPSQQLNILQTYKQKLIFKNKIDKEVLHRTRENDSNQKRLQALKIKYLKFPKKTTDIYRKEVDDALALHDDAKGKSDYDVKDLTTSINAHRSDTTWFRELLLSFINSSATQSDSFKKYLELNTYVGFSIYGIRGGWEIAKLIKHTFIDDNPFYQKNQLGTLDRLSVQLQIRYPIIVNDVVWGLTNSISYFLLKNNDPTAGWLTFIMSFVDLISMIKQTYDIQQNFKQLEDALDVVPKEIQEKHDRAMKSQYLSILIQIGMIASFIAVFTLLPGVAPVAGVIACFVMQVFNNIKDHLLQIYNSNDPNERWTIALKMILRVMLQAIIPAMFILCSLYLIPIVQTAAAFWVINISLIILTKLMVDFVSKLNENFSNYMMSDEKIKKITSEKQKFSTELEKIESKIISDEDEKIESKIISDEDEIKKLLNFQSRLNKQLLSSLNTPDFTNLCKTIQIQQNELAVKISELKNSSSAYQDKKNDLMLLVEKTSQSLEDVKQQKGASIDNIKEQLNLFIGGASLVSLLVMSVFSLGGAFIALPAALMLISAVRLAYVKFTKSSSEHEVNPNQAPVLPPPNRA